METRVVRAVDTNPRLTPAGYPPLADRSAAFLARLPAW